MKEYTDLQYKDASQIAYVTFLNKQNKILQAQNPDSTENDHYTVAELVRSSFDEDAAKREWEKHNPGKELSKDPNKQLKQLIKYADGISDNDKKTLQNISADSYNWKFVFCQDTNDDNGFYGCVLETPNSNPDEKGNLMVAFRGSEGLRNFKQLKPDWKIADFGLLNGETPQQAQVRDFADEFSKKVLPEYKDKQIDVAGHSLGGNLASFFTIYSCKKHREIFDQIHRCYNLDGPNIKDEEIAAYGPDVIGESAEKIVHYKASTIGNLFSILQGNGISEDIRFVHVKKIDGFPLLLPFLRHDTVNWDFDKDGNIIQDDGPDLVSAVVSGLCEVVDFLNIEPIVYFMTSFVFDWMLGPGDDNKTTVTPLGIAILIDLAAKLIMSSLAPIVITGILMLGVIYYIGNIGLDDKFEEFFNNLYNSIKVKMGNDISYLDKIYHQMLDYIINNKDSFATAINFERPYTNNNPIIQLDTNAMRDYAYRLERVNQRLSNLDGRIKNLYYQVGLTDILRILNADFSVGYNNTLKRCSNYLNETANDFEQVERNIESAF